MWITLLIAFLSRWLPLIETLGPEVVQLAKDFLSALQKQQQMRGAKCDEDPRLKALACQMDDLREACCHICEAAQHNQTVADAISKEPCPPTPPVG